MSSAEREALILNLSQYVRPVAIRFSRMLGMAVEDAEQEGMLAVIRAADAKGMNCTPAYVRKAIKCAYLDITRKRCSKKRSAILLPLDENLI